MKCILRNLLLASLVPVLGCTSGSQSSTPQSLPTTDNTSEVNSALQQTQAALGECEQQAAANAGVLLSAAATLSQSSSSTSTLGTSGITPTTGTTTSGSCSSDITTAVELLISAHDSTGQLAINSSSFLSYLESFFSTMFQAAGTGLSSTQQAQLVASAWQLYQQIAPSLPTTAQSQLSSYLSTVTAASTAASASSTTVSLPAAPSGYTYEAVQVTNSLGTSGYSYELEPTSSAYSSGYSWVTGTSTGATTSSSLTLSPLTSDHQSRTISNSRLKVESQKVGNQGTINLVY